MNDKEQLGEIKDWISKLFGYETVKDDAMYYMKKKHINWLIKHAEKAEKYREVLEFYADESIYSARNKERAEITLDYGEKARQALESDN